MQGDKTGTKNCLYCLLNYRATPHVTTGVPPSMLLFNHVIKAKLPQTISTKRRIQLYVKLRDEDAKATMKVLADKMRKAKPSEIQVGDTVLSKQKKRTKLSSKFDPVPFQVMRIKGTMITVVQNGRYVT